MAKSVNNTIIGHSSFRDKSNFVFEHQGNIYRAFTAESYKSVYEFLTSELYSRLKLEKKIIETKIVEEIGIDLPTGFEFIVQHKKIEIITYKDNWTFNMLKDAALLTLDIQENLLKEGLTLKDASVFNVQFINSKPIFIDLGSIVHSSQEIFWSGYRQFTEMFLNPLTISSSLQLNLQDFYMNTTRGIKSETTWKFLKLRDKIKFNNLINIKLQINKNKIKVNRLMVDRELENAGFNLKMRINQIKKLRKIVMKLEAPVLNTVWTDYSDRSHYESIEIQTKKKFIENAFAEKKYRTVIDWGCNDGLFSEYVVQQAEFVKIISLDFDSQVLDKLYIHSKENNLKILPLVFDISNPPVNYGFENLERLNFLNLIDVDLNLAYALVHHLFISDNLPWSKIISLFVDRGDLIIEFPLPYDEKVLELLNQKKEPEIYLREYNIDSFEEELKKYFKISIKKNLNSRILYYCENQSDERRTKQTL